MTILFLTYSGIFGAIIGSFLTAWIWRTYTGKSMLEKHSICPHCGHSLGALDLIPVFSYIGLGGKCRYCKAAISTQYVATEIATAILFIVSFIYLFGLSSEQPAFDAWSIISLVFTWIVVSLLIALFIYDLRWGFLPDIWTLGGSALVAIVTILARVMHQPLLWQPGVESYSLLPTLLSGLISAAFFLVIVWGSEKILHKQGMGFGDVKLALLMGLFLGFPAIIVALYLAFILGAVLSLLLLAAKQKSFGQAIPFGPFLIAATLLAWWITPLVVNWYQYL